MSSVLEPKTKTKTYMFCSDPGHGWLRVKRAELDDLGIADKISCASYSKGEYVYLEEDGDAPKFVKKLEQKGIKVKFNEKFYDNYFPVECLAYYIPTTQHGVK